MIRYFYVVFLIFFHVYFTFKHAYANNLKPLSLVDCARLQIGKTLIYDPSYEKIAFPLGDIALQKGVCTDVIIRALRVFGIDLQKNVAKSIKKHHAIYKKYLTKERADPNIDHRRVKVLALYFKEQGWEQKTTTYKAGDILVFDLGKGIWHIAIVSDRTSLDKKRLLVIHNINAGVQEEDFITTFPVLFCFRPMITSSNKSK
jgi:uncharacterized protein YijF (DUF1287 family)